MTIYRWVQRFTPLLIDAARPCRHVPGDRWFIDETYVKVVGRWVYLYRAIDQYGQVIEVPVSPKRDLEATGLFFIRAPGHCRCPTEVTTDRAAAYPPVIEELIPAACHVTERYANNLVEADHGRLKAWLRPMRGLTRLRSARVISARRAFVQTSVAVTTISVLISTDGISSQRPSPNSPTPSNRGSTTENLVCFPPTQQTRPARGSALVAGVGGVPFEAAAHPGAHPAQEPLELRRWRGEQAVVGGLEIPDQVVV